MRQMTTSTTIATATALILAVAPTWVAAFNCDGPPAGTPAQERACAEQKNRTWNSYPMVFGNYLCTRRDNSVQRWARWWYYTADPNLPPVLIGQTVDFYIGGEADCHPEDWEKD